jgi:aspartate ammonia-lyase
MGYEKSAAIAKEALKTGGSVYHLVLEKGWLTKETTWTTCCGRKT